jgi:hypothetical protein
MQGPNSGGGFRISGVTVAYHVLPTNQTSACTCATKPLPISTTLHRVRLDSGLLASVPPKDQYVNDFRRA